MLIVGSGFQEIVLKSGLPTFGSLNSILTGSHHDCCWNIHAHFSEALERFLPERFLVDQSYHRYKGEVRSGKRRKTAHFRLVNYLNITHFLNGTHISCSAGTQL